MNTSGKPKQLSDQPDRLSGAELRPDFPSPGGCAPVTARVAFALGREQTGRLMEWSGGEHLPIAAALMTALKICLFRCTGAGEVGVDILPGGHSDGKNAARPLRVVSELNANLTFEELFSAVSASLGEAVSEAGQRTDERAAGLAFENGGGGTAFRAHSMTLTVDPRGGRMECCIDFDKARLRNSSA